MRLDRHYADRMCQRRLRAKRKAAGLCSCGAKPDKGMLCAKCIARNSAYYAARAVIHHISLPCGQPNPKAATWNWDRVTCQRCLGIQGLEP